MKERGTRNEGQAAGTPANSNPVKDQSTRDATTPCWLLAMRDADEDAERYLEAQERLRKITP